MRPASDCPSTVVRSHEDRRASTSSDNGDDDADVSEATAGVFAGADDAAATDAGSGADAAGALVDRAAVSEASALSPERNHQIVPTRTATPATPNNPTKSAARRLAGTGTASLGNGDESSMRDVAADSDGAAAENDGVGYDGDGSDGDGSDGGAGSAIDVSENMLRGSGSGNWWGSASA
jgi:hypothetical protein